MFLMALNKRFLYTSRILIFFYFNTKQEITLHIQSLNMFLFFKDCSSYLLLYKIIYYVSGNQKIVIMI